jgi:DNA invertase Pin-like site-specific DNA recombinase
MSTTPTRVVGYLRVSTQQQADEGVSLEAQRTKLRASAVAMDLELVALCEDAGVSAKTLDRPGLRAALALLDQGQADGLVVAKLDRLTRSVRDLGELVDRYFERRFALLCLADSLDTRTASGRLVLHVLGAVSQWEREATAERTRDALAQVRADGGILGREGFGWKRATADATAPCGHPVKEPIESERITIRRVVELRAGGQTFVQIAAGLEAEGHATKRGGRWHPTTIQRILRRERCDNDP